MSTDLNKILPRADQYDTANQLLAQLCVNTGSKDPTRTWSEIQTIIRTGKATEYFKVGDQFTTFRATSITATPTGVSSVVIDWDKFLANRNVCAAGTYEFTYDGIWKLAGAVVDMGQYGILYSGTAASGNKISVVVAGKNLVWDILGFDYDKPVDSRLQHSMTLGMHDIFMYNSIAFDASEYMYYASAKLAPGTYHFTLDHGMYNGNTGSDGTYQFTTTVEIPVGGGFRHDTAGQYYSDGYTKERIIGNYITTYAADGITTLESGLAVTEGSGGTDLGKFTASNPTYRTNPTTNNYTERQRYGSNRWATSAERQYLNANLPASKWWKKRHDFDRPSVTNINGFLYGLDPVFKQAIMPVTKRTALITADRSTDLTYEDLEEFIWLQSRGEVFNSNEISTANERGDGSQTDRYPYWQTTATGTGADPLKIKYEGSTARYWWLRSPISSYAYNTRYVYTDGSLSYYGAYYARGVVPACVIA